MIKEISIDEIPERHGWNITKRGEFCRKTIAGFILSGMRCAEVVGFPEGEIDPKTAHEYSAYFRRAMKAREFDGFAIKVRTRAGRLFLVRGEE